MAGDRDGQGRLKDGEGRRRPRPFLSPQASWSWAEADGAARWARDHVPGLELGGPLPTPGQTLDGTSRQSLSCLTAPLPQANTPLFPAGSWLSFVVFIFPKWGELLRAGLSSNWSGTIFLLPGPLASLREDSHWVCLPSLHLALHGPLRGACRAGAGRPGQPASCRVFAAVIWESSLPMLCLCQSMSDRQNT